MEIKESSSQTPVNAGQFAAMGSAISTDRMARSCVELLTRHLGMNTDAASKALGMDPELVRRLSGQANGVPVVIPSGAMPRIERLCAIQSMLLSCYTLPSMVRWFHSNLPGKTETPLAVISNDNENGLSRVLQAAIGRASH